ncbi:MAG: hypothetical protein IJY25_02585 [Bacilli bacterium]|nr:hypothetical protein [Bacilli bacterium]
MATNLNSYQVQNLVFPELTKASEWIQGAYNLSLNLKSVLPSSTMYKSYVNELPTKIYNIKSKINSVNSELQTKLSNATKIESSLNSKMDGLLATLIQMNSNIEGSAVLNYENSEVVNSAFEQSLQVNEKSYETVARRYDAQINQLKAEMENNTDIQNLEKQIENIDLQLRYASRINMTKETEEELRKKLEELSNEKARLIRAYTKPIEELEKQKQITVNYVQSMYYSNLTNNLDFSLETTVKDLSEEEKNEMAKLYEALAAQSYTEDIYDFNKIKSSEIGRLNLDWKLIKGVYDKGFTIFDLILANPEILGSDITLNDIAKADSKGEYTVGDYAHMLYFLNEEERNIAMYLYNTEGMESAKEYFNFKIKEINNREGTYEALQFLNELDPYDPFGNIEELIKEGLVDGTGNFIEGLDNAMGGVDGIASAEQYKAMYIVQWLSCEDIDSIDYLSQEAKNKLKQIQSTMPKELRTSVYEISSSIGNMLPPITISVGVSFLTQNPEIGSKVGAVLMGVSAGGNATETMVQQGYDLNQAIFYGTLSGSSEALLGYYLGKIPGLSKIDDIPGLKGYLSNILSEGGEEALQAVIDPYLQSVAFGTSYSVDWNEVKKSGIYGMITAGIMNGGKLIIDGVSININDISTKTIETIAKAEQYGMSVEYDQILNQEYLYVMEEFTEEIDVLIESNTIEGNILTVIAIHDAKYGSGTTLQKLNQIIDPNSKNYKNYNIITRENGARGILSKYTPDQIKAALNNLTNNKVTSVNSKNLKTIIVDKINKFFDKGKTFVKNMEGKRIELAPLSQYNSSRDAKIQQTTTLIFKTYGKYVSSKEIADIKNHIIIYETDQKFEDAVILAGGKDDPKGIAGFHDPKTGTINLRPSNSLNVYVHESLHQLGSLKSTENFRALNEAVTDYLTYKATFGISESKYLKDTIVIESLDNILKQKGYSGLIEESYFNKNPNGLRNVVNNLAGDNNFYNNLAEQFQKSQNVNLSEKERDAANKAAQIMIANLGIKTGVYDKVEVKK